MARAWFGNSVRRFKSEKDTIARGMTDVDVGSSALLGVWGEAENLVMVVEQHPPLGVWPDDEIVGRWIAEVAPMVREDRPTGAQCAVGRPRNGDGFGRFYLLGAQPTGAFFIGNIGWLRDAGELGELARLFECLSRFLFRHRLQLSQYRLGKRGMATVGPPPR